MTNRGGNNRKSDAEKKAEGTFRESRSEEAYNAAAGARVITGVFLSKIPEPSLPLNKDGRGQYDKLTKLLFEQNKLTEVTCGDCERMAVMHQQMVDRLNNGKNVPVDLIKRMDAISVRLRIAENATTIATPGAKNRFEGSGFSNTRVSTFRLQPLRSDNS